MFGEKSIYGQSIVHFDAKKRLVLPKFTLVQPKDSLLVVKNIDYLSVYEESHYEKIIKEIEKEYLTYDANKKRECDLKLLELYKSILKKVEVDCQKRINLGGIETDRNDFLCVGAKDHVILETSFLGLK